jgi:hypothetical protein
VDNERMPPPARGPPPCGQPRHRHYSIRLILWATACQFYRFGWYGKAVGDEHMSISSHPQTRYSTVRINVNAPAEVWYKLRKRALEEGKTATELVLEGIEGVLARPKARKPPAEAGR